MRYHITSYQTKSSPFTPLLSILHHFFNFLSLYLYGNLITLLIIFIIMKRILLSFLLTRKTAPAKSVCSNGHPVQIMKVIISCRIFSTLYPLSLYLPLLPFLFSRSFLSSLLPSSLPPPRLSSFLPFFLPSLPPYLFLFLSLTLSHSLYLYYTLT